MRIAQISDTHQGTTKSKTIKACLGKMGLEDFDIILHNGDYSGGSKGHAALKLTVDMIREIFPDKPYVTNIGNHDYWCRFRNVRRKSRDTWGRPEFNNPPLQNYTDNYQRVLEVFEKNDVHFLDTDGPFRFQDCVIVGHSGWYANPNIHLHTQDLNFLPLGIEGDTHRWMQKQAMDGLYKNLDCLTEEDKTKTILFSSHFPVIKNAEVDPGFDVFAWSAHIGDWMQEEYGIRYFFNGHAHQSHKGPLKYECGSDYFNPKYHIVEVS